MQNNKEQQMSDSFLVGTILAMVGGFLDAYTYILRGKVFANAQTGNIVLLGVKIAEHNFVEGFYYLIPIVAFVLGVIVTQWINHHFKPFTIIHWRQIAIILEILVLFIIGFLPIGHMDTIANSMVSFVCAMQVCSFKSLKGAAYATTMCTGNLRSATEQLYLYVSKRDWQAGIKSIRYYSIIMFFIVGAIIGATASITFGKAAVWLCCVMLAIVFVVMFEPKKD